MRSTLFSSLLICSMNLIGCEADVSEVSEHKETVATARPFTQSESNDAQSCLEACGAEARGTVYASCIETGETRQECGSSAREWYRDCLHTRCDESAIQQDDCRTDCRINVKDQIRECASDPTNEQECKSEIRTVMRTCIDECE